METSVIQQFLKDGKETKGNKLDSIQIEKVYNLFKRENVSAGDIVLNAEFSSKGGNIEIRKITELRNEWNTYGDYLDIKCLETTVLIEHPTYQSKETQPFNRQPPFYIPYGFRDLEMGVINDWNIYHTGQRNSNICFPTNKFFYNDYWDKYTGSAIVKEKDLMEFVTLLLTKSGISDQIVNYVSNCIKNI